MKSIIITELASNFLVQGLSLHEIENSHYVGKPGRNEVELISEAQPKVSVEGEAQILSLGTTDSGMFRVGDVLMAGCDELLDRAFRALDEMEQRGVVVGLDPSNSSLAISNEWLCQQTQEWKEKRIPYLCLFMVEPVDSEVQAKFVTLIRKLTA